MRIFLPDLYICCPDSSAPTFSPGHGSSSATPCKTTNFSMYSADSLRLWLLDKHVTFTSCFFVFVFVDVVKYHKQSDKANFRLYMR